MSTKGAFPPLYAVERRRKTRSLPFSGLKRKFCSLLPPSEQRQLCYPSPPMSRHPSPLVPAAGLSNGATNEHSALFRARSPSSNDKAAMVPVGSHLVRTTSSPTPTSLPQSGASSDLPALGLSVTGSSSSQTPSFATLHTAIVASGAPAFTTGPSLTGQSSNRSGRKTKAHVASACINCKRAHLSCDVQRPCARCVASGKQDTCYDVQHKKRGRPRLREEGDFKVGRMVTEQPAGMRMPIAGRPSSSRPMAMPRERRRDSFQPFSSDVPERPSLLTTGLPPPPIFHSSFDQAKPSSNGTSPLTGVPTAFLDVDLIILRANQPFQQILNDGQPVKGRQLSEVAVPADKESFEVIRNRLRAEREDREPSYLPPIIHSGQDPIRGVSEVDVERLTYGFADHTYKWKRSPTDPTLEAFAAQVRLAKSTSYFVVVTLPGFRPGHSKRPSPVPITSFAPPQLSPISAHQNPPVTKGVHRPMPASFLPPSPRPYSGAQPYPPYLRRSSYHYPVLPSTLPLPTAEPPFEARSFGPPTTMGEMTQPSATRNWLASGNGHSMMTAGPSGRPDAPLCQRYSLSSDEGGSPNKRRRVGIEEVLQH